MDESFIARRQYNIWKSSGFLRGALIRAVLNPEGATWRVPERCATEIRKQVEDITAGLRDLSGYLDEGVLRRWGLAIPADQYILINCTYPYVTMKAGETMVEITFRASHSRFLKVRWKVLNEPFGFQIFDMYGSVFTAVNFLIETRIAIENGAEFTPLFSFRKPRS